MTKNCSTCFFSSPIYAGKEPCNSCFAFDKFVSATAFVDVPPPQYDPKTVAFNQGVKYDSGKPQWSLMQWKALSQVVDVLTYGAKKYAPDNWKKVPNARQRYLDAGFRHFAAYAAGEKNDSETGMSHLAHAMCCMLFLLAFDLGEDK
jgi:hypothetical protein